MAMKILLSAAFVRPGLVGGAEHMVRNLLTGMSLEGVDLTTISRFEAPGRSWARVDPDALTFWSEWKHTARLRDRHDAVIFTNYITTPGAHRWTQRVVTVIHDAQYLSYPQFFAPRLRLWIRANHMHSLRAADHIVVPSQYVRETLIASYGDRWSNKVVTIPNAISWDRFSPATSPQPDLGRYILSVAAQYPHKNLRTLLRAFERLEVNPRHSDVKLVLVGQAAANLRHTRGGVKEVRASSPRVTYTGYVNDAQLGALYKGAAVFVFPSLFEGFGMPPVEALGFRIPTITTKATAIPEVTLGYANYVDNPESPSELAQRITDVLDAPDEFRVSADKAAALREAYSPRRIARQFLDLLDEPAEGPS